MKNTLLSASIAISLLFCTAGCNIFSSKSEPSANTNSASSNSNVPVSKPSNTSGKNTVVSYASGPLLGKWEEKDDASHTMEFKEDGSLTIEYAGRTINEKYSYMSDNQISNTDSKGKVRTPNFTVKGNEMTLTWSDAVVETAKNQHFVRVKK